LLQTLMQIRRSHERGHASHGWLDTYHTFSFADYYDPAQMGFRALRVLNEDRIRPARGFATHSHRDMEIVTFVLEGALEHKDTTGGGSILRPGDVQRMTAGTGVSHSEVNPSPTQPVHLLQIWILPARSALAPSYEQRTFADAEKQGCVRVVASADGREGSVTIHQDAAIYASLLAPDQRVTYSIPAGRHAWVQIARGRVELAGTELFQGDGVALSEAGELSITAAANAAEPAELLIFDLA